MSVRYICLDCERDLSEDEIRTYQENFGPEPNLPCWQTFSVCGYCGGDYEVAVECTHCKRFVPQSETGLYLGETLCGECIDYIEEGNE